MRNQTLAATAILLLGACSTPPPTTPSSREAYLTLTSASTVTAASEERMEYHTVHLSEDDENTLATYGWKPPDNNRVKYPTVFGNYFCHRSLPANEIKDRPGNQNPYPFKVVATVLRLSTTTSGRCANIPGSPSVTDWSARKLTMVSFDPSWSRQRAVASLYDRVHACPDSPYSPEVYQTSDDREVHIFPCLQPSGEIRFGYIYVWEGLRGSTLALLRWQPNEPVVSAAPSVWADEDTRAQIVERLGKGFAEAVSGWHS